MKTKRSISINNSLVHGICNFNCITCSVNKKSYTGLRKYQDEKITRLLIDRILEAAQQGVRFARIENSGDGEPTLHPDFFNRMNLFGEMIRTWPTGKSECPEIALVSNGNWNNRKQIFQALIKNKLNLKLSIPTFNPEHYGEIMLLDAKAGKTALAGTLKTIELAMRLAGLGKIGGLTFHISPPYLKHLVADFNHTLHTLVKLANKNRLFQIHLTMFPAVANRTGRIKVENKKIEKYSDFFRKYNGKKIGGVRVGMRLSYELFYEKKKDLMDVYHSYRYPCLWLASSLFISPNGETYCCNDQNISEPFGSLERNSIKSMIETKENVIPANICSCCNQTPQNLLSLKLFTSYHQLVLEKLRK